MGREGERKGRGGEGKEGRVAPAPTGESGSASVETPGAPLEF